METYLQNPHTNCSSNLLLDLDKLAAAGMFFKAVRGLGKLITKPVSGAGKLVVKHPGKALGAGVGVGLVGYPGGKKALQKAKIIKKPKQRW